MKKKVARAILVIMAIGLLVEVMYLVDRNRMKNNKEVIFSTWGVKYEPSLQGEETNNGENNRKIIISHNQIENIDLLDNFFDNTTKYNENKVSDSIVIVQYTTEGDEIITTLKYSKEKEQYEVTVDNLADRYAAKEDRKVETKIYPDFAFDVIKKTEDDYVYMILKEDSSIRTCGTEPLQEIIICSYKKDLEEN